MLPDAVLPSAVLPDAPRPAAEILLAQSESPASAPAQSSSAPADPVAPAAPSQPQTSSSSAAAPVPPEGDRTATGEPISLDRKQPQRILGFMPNFRTVSAGAKTHPLSWGYNFQVASHQALDYSTFLFLGLTSITAEGLNQHPSLGKGADGFWAYTWRGFLDKTDGTYLQAWLLPSLLHEDTRYYPLGNHHRIVTRVLYIISRQGVSRTYGGRQTPNLAGLGGKALTQYVSRFYYPTGAQRFGVLATKFGYSSMRDVMFSSIREFYPDIAAHFIRRHRQKKGIVCDVKTQVC
jgi:hypothetical protein